MPTRSNTELVRIDTLGGMDERFAADPGSAAYINNMRLGPMGWETAGGYEDLQGGLTVNRVVRDIFWWNQRGARQWVVFSRDAAGGGSLEVMHSKIGAPGSTTFQTDWTLIDEPNPGISFLDRGAWLWVVNGYDEPIRWNGEEVVRVGFGILPQPPQVTDFIFGYGAMYDELAADYSTSATYLYSTSYQRGVGEALPDHIVPFAYGYAVTYLNDQGQESPPSEIVWIRSGNPAMDLVANTLRGRRSIRVYIDAPPAHVRGIRLYRTPTVITPSRIEYDTTVFFDFLEQTEAARLYFHSEYPAAGNFHIFDDHPDSELGPELNIDQVGLWPAGARFICEHKGTVFAAGMPEYPNRVRYSAPLLAEQWPEVNYVPVGGRVVALVSGQNAVVVFLRRGLHLIKGDPYEGFRAEQLFAQPGCAAGPNAIVEVPGLGLLYLSDDGPYILTGTMEDQSAKSEAVFVGGPIYETWKRVNQSALVAARAAVYHRDREVWIQVPVDGSSWPNLGLIYHYETGVWSVREDYPINCLAEIGDHRGLLAFGSWDTTTHDGVFVYHVGAGTMDGDAITATYRSGWLDLGNKRSIVRRVDLGVVTHGRDLTVQWRKDRAVSWEATADSGYKAIDSERTAPLWDTATWSATEAYEEYVPTIVRVDFHQAQAHEFQFEVSATKLQLFRYTLNIVAPTDIRKQRQVG